jgi:hypothetical protein
MEGYAKAHDLVVWTSAPLLGSPAPVYDDAKGEWTIHVGQPGGGSRMVKCKHVVLTTGTLGPPKQPTVPGADAFCGSILHASRFDSGAAYKGQRVLVVGGANTAADVCEDLVASGAQSVTMLQRSPTCVVLPRALQLHFLQTFPPGTDVELCDFRIASVPFAVRERLILEEREKRKERGEDPDVETEDLERMKGMKEKGFLVDHGPGGRGLLFVILEKFGGTSTTGSVSFRWEARRSHALDVTCRSSRRRRLLGLAVPRRCEPQDRDGTREVYRKDGAVQGRKRDGSRRRHLCVCSLLPSLTRTALLLHPLLPDRMPPSCGYSSIATLSPSFLLPAILFPRNPRIWH